MILLTLIIGLSYDATRLDAPKPEIDPYNTQNLMALPLGQPDAHGMIPYELFGIPGKHGYIVQDHTLYDRLKSQYAGQVAYWDEHFGKIQPILYDPERQVLIMSWEQMVYFYTLQLSCPQCYPVKLIEQGKAYSDSLLAEIAKQQNQGRLPKNVYYTHMIKLDKDIHSVPFYFESIAFKGNDRLKVALFLESWTLDYFEIRVSSEIPKSVDHPVPDWVMRRLDYNEAWIKAAKRHLQGLSWEQYLFTHHCIPGDRSIPDMMYNRILNIRGSSLEEYKRRIMPGPDDPYEFALGEFTAHYQEIEDANKMVDVWIETMHRPLDVAGLAKRKAEEYASGELWRKVKELINDMEF